MKFERYQLIRTSNTLEIRDCLLGQTVSFAALPRGMPEKLRQSEEDFTAEELKRLNAYQDLTSPGRWEKNIGYVLGPQSSTGIRINMYQEEIGSKSKPTIRLSMLHRTPIEHEKDDEGSYLLMDSCDLDLPELQLLIAKLQAAESQMQYSS